MAENSEDERVATCASCEKTLHGKLLSCSNCKQTCYCNRDCQKTHWPLHKIRCKDLQKARKAAIDNNQRRLYHLLHEWKDESREIMVECLLGYFGWEAMASMEPQRHIVFLKVDFDYNSCTFVPTEPPKITPVDFVSGPQAAQIHRLYDEAKQSRPPSHMSSIEFAPVISFVDYTGKQALIQTNMIELDDEMPQISFDEMVHELKEEVTLTSKKFAKWLPLRNTNIQKQINAIKRNENFKPFVANALRMISSEPRHSTHAVKIHLNEGLELGEIKSLRKFELVDIQEAKKELKGSILLDQGGYNAMVLFSGDNINRVLCVGVELGHAKESLLTVEESDSKAIAGFYALSHLKLPSVDTPPLH